MGLSPSQYDKEEEEGLSTKRKDSDNIMRLLYGPETGKEYGLTFLRSVVIVKKEKPNDWSKFWFDFMSCPFLFKGELECLFNIGDTIDVEYYYSKTSKGLWFLHIKEMKHSQVKGSCICKDL